VATCFDADRRNAKYWAPKWIYRDKWLKNAREVVYYECGLEEMEDGDEFIQAAQGVAAVEATDASLSTRVRVLGSLPAERSSPPSILPLDGDACIPAGNVGHAL